MSNPTTLVRAFDVRERSQNTDPISGGILTPLWQHSNAAVAASGIELYLPEPIGGTYLRINSMVPTIVP